MTENRSAHSLRAFPGLQSLSPSRLRQALAMGLKSLWVHRLRSLLTVLGIVFGVCSVIAMLAIGEGASYEAQEQIRRLGSNNIILRSVKPPEEQKSTAEQSYVLEYGLRHADMKRIRATIPGITILVPARIIRRNVWCGPRRVDADIVGTVPWYIEVTNNRVVRGRFFTDDDLEGERNVCLLDQLAAAQLFPIDDPLGRTVRVEEDYFRVIGLMAPAEREASRQGEEQAPPAQNAVEGAPYRMYIPLTVAKSQFGEVLMERRSGTFSAERVELHEIVIKVAQLDDVVETSLIIDEILNEHHKKKDYVVVVPLELLRSAERTKRIFNIVLGSIAAISLLVGGIGIMNIMLATVTERTREIGIRRAIGARRRDIILQFLTETVLLSGTGGVIGVGLGLSIPYFITFLAHMQTIVTLWAPLLAFAISVMVGVVFGIYPAIRAADMDPVEALRHE